MMPSVIGENTENEALVAANLQENTEIDKAVEQYYRIRSQYNDILTEAIRTQDPAKRTKLVSTITALNQQLSTIVASIQQKYTTSKQALGSLPPINFAADLEQYKLDLEQLMTERDELTKLKTIHSTLASSATTATPSYLYVIVIFGMLIVLLLMFTFTSLMTSVSSVISSIPIPELPNLGLSAPTPGPVM
jgi:hypothetical protein